MGIQPIDLQTLYLQMDKVGKQQGAEQKAKADAIVEQGEKAKAEQAQKETSVSKMEKYEHIDVNKDGHNANGFDTMEEKKDAGDRNVTASSADDEFFTDPNLGRKIDFSG